LKYIPDHPAADEKGYVKMPNVNTLVEIMDVREAQRSYEANLGMIEQARSMILRTIDLLRA
jgi:flagellar basal-body rod protein FlgC